jgi:hypothetical protein
MKIAMNDIPIVHVLEPAGNVLELYPNASQV